MTPEQYGALRETLGRLEQGQSGIHQKLDAHIERAEEADTKHDSRLHSLEGSRNWARGIAAAFGLIFSLYESIKR